MAGQAPAAAPPPNPAVVAALRGEFAKVYNGRRLRTQAQAALVARFAGRGESLVDVISHVTIDKADEDGWRRLWTNLFANLRSHLHSRRGNPSLPDHKQNVNG